MNDAYQFRVLLRKQLAVQEGIDMIRRDQAELAMIASTGNVWAGVAVACRAVMIPLNIIVNAGQLGTGKRILGVLGEQLVRVAYQKHGASGTGLSSNINSWEGIAKIMLGSLKAGVVAELKQKGLTNYIPGANILIGLSEDSLSLMSVLTTVTQGSAEFRTAAHKQQMQLIKLEKELLAYGILANQHLERIQIINRTA